MTPEQRETLADSAFLEGETIIDGADGAKIRLRPFSTILTRYIERLGLTFLQGQIDGLTQSELFRQIAVFAWFHAQPIAEVLQHMRRGTWAEAAEEWEAAHMTFDGIKSLMRDTARWAAQAEAAAFDLQPRDEDGATEDPPGNC